MLERIVVAIDCDGVLTRTDEALIAYSNRTWCTDLTTADFSEDLPKMWGLSLPEAKVRWHDFCENNFASLELMPHAAEAVAEMPEVMSPQLATSRPLRYRAVTERYVSSWLPRIIRFNYLDVDWENDPNACCLTKRDLYREMGADVVIEDEPKHCFAAYADGKTAILFGDSPRLHDVEVPDGVFRAQDWEEAADHLYKLSERLVA